MKIMKLLLSTSLFFSLMFLVSCKRKPGQLASTIERTPAEVPITIFVHGTLPPVADRLVHAWDIPLGLHAGQDVKSYLFMGKIPYLISEIDPLNFPLAAFYVFGWSGDLSFTARKKAALELYYAIKSLDIKGPLTLIGHSHGCNVILNLAAIAEERKDQSFKVERAILLAGPVQRATSVFIHSDVFKKIYSFYSHTDLIQILDPQGLYKECKSFKDITFFSQHIFAPHEKLVQIQVKKGRRGIWHTEFIMKEFIQKLPKIIRLLDEKAAFHEGMYKFTVDLKNLTVCS